MSEFFSQRLFPSSSIVLTLLMMSARSWSEQRWQHFCGVGGSRDMASIFIYVNHLKRFLLKMCRHGGPERSSPLSNDLGWGTRKNERWIQFCSRPLCLCWGNNDSAEAGTCWLKGSVLRREARPGVVMLSLAGDLAAVWHLADPAVQLRDYRPPRVAVMWSRLSPTHSWWPRTFTVRLTDRWKDFSLECSHNFPRREEYHGRIFAEHANHFVV